MKNIVKKIASTSLYIFLFSFFVLLLVEVYFRSIPNKKIKINKRISSLWRMNNHNKSSPFFPPHLAFANHNEHNQDRLDLIAKKTIFPASKEWTTKDFLRNPNEDSSFKVRTNQYGFRDTKKTRTKSKAKNIYRIFVIGSYPAFGMGVENEETYPAQLEAALSNTRIKGKKIEVWNAGRQGSTAIMGLALLKKYIIDFDPDFIIFDYGQADLFTVKDSKQIRDREMEKKLGPERFVFLKRFSARARSYSIIMRKLNRFLHAKDFPKKLGYWKNINRELIKYLKARNIPLILLRHRIEAIKKESYADLVDENNNIYFLNSEDAWDAAPPNKEWVEKFWSEPNWTTEFRISKEENKFNTHYIYNTDSFFPNSEGHRLIANQLAQKIKQINSIK